MLESLGKTLRGKLERNINEKKKKKEKKSWENTEGRNRKNAQFTAKKAKFHNPKKK